jgi:hypothetical protein
MNSWIARFEQAIEADMDRREAGDTREWAFKTLGVVVIAAIALVAQLALFT